eukprot:6912810-Heterocapsa_arctica.AAC.1
MSGTLPSILQPVEQCAGVNIVTSGAGSNDVLTSLEGFGGSKLTCKRKRQLTWESLDWTGMEIRGQMQRPKKVLI